MKKPPRPKTDNSNSEQRHEPGFEPWSVVPSGFLQRRLGSLWLPPSPAQIASLPLFCPRKEKKIRWATKMRAWLDKWRVLLMNNRQGIQKRKGGRGDMNVQVRHCSEGVVIENLKRPTVSTKSWVEMPTTLAILDAWPLLSPYFARRSDKGWDFRQQQKKEWSYITQRLEPFDVDLSCFWRQSVFSS